MVIFIVANKIYKIKNPSKEGFQINKSLISDYIFLSLKLPEIDLSTNVPF